MNRTAFLIALMASTTFATAAQSASFVPYHSPAAPMFKGAAGVSVNPLITVGETLPNGFQPTGIFDGIGAFSLNATTVRVLVNSELGSTSGKSYTVSNGAGGSVSLTGARVSYFDIDKASRGIIDAGIAHTEIYDRLGNIVTNATQIGGGFNRLCSSAAFEANSFGAGKGIADRIYFAGEEAGNGTMWAIDTGTGHTWAVPAMGYGSWENATQIDTGTPNKVAFILGDDSGGAPLYLYVGEKNAVGDGSFLDRNGLVSGKLYAWKADGGDVDPSTFNGSVGADNRSGSWIEVTVKDAAKAGMPGYDAQGYALASTLQNQAEALGAFNFSRPEDVATNPADGTLVALASTGRDSLFGGADSWGTVYTIDTDFDASGNPTGADVKIVYDGDADPNRALRSPDNLDWRSATELLIQEDRSTDWASAFAANPNEAGVLSLLLNGTLNTIARIDPTALPFGQTDGCAGDVGCWESSGILDVSALFGAAAGSLFLADVQAHGVSLGSKDLGEGGQLAFLSLGSAVPEPALWVQMIAGFGVVGAAMRRHRQKLPSVLA